MKCARCQGGAAGYVCPGCLSHPEENEAGYLLARAGGGFKGHILPPGWRTAGRWQSALCGHVPGNRGPGGIMKPRGRWYYAGAPFGFGKRDCEKCAAEYERRTNTEAAQ